MSKFDLQFGFKNVKPEEKKSLVTELFTKVASKYDLMNDVMSMGLHRLWKKELVNKIAPYPGMQFIDMATGSCDIIKLVYDKIMQQSGDELDETLLIACDNNKSMLEVGQKKMINQGIIKGINWLHADATKIPVARNSIDVYAISFGLRNIVDISKAMHESYRLLKPGGRFLCLEFSKITQQRFHQLFNKIYKLYSFKIIPKLGKIIINDEQAYQYLVESIHNFPAQQELANMLAKVGFSKVSWQNLSHGIVAIHSGIKE